MKELKKKISELLTNAWDEIEYRLRLLCGKPTPLKRLITILIVGGILTIVHIWFVVSSIYNMGKHDSEKDFLRLQHIESLKLQTKNDSINILNQKEYECEQ